MAPPDRKGGSGLSLRTLAIASAASLTAALATSQLFPPGTIYASALTPVIVAAVSELLNRPADRVSELRRQKRTLAQDARRLQTARIMGDEPSPLRGAPEFALGEDADREFATNGGGEQPPIRIYEPPLRRILHPKVWIATGLAAFAIAAAVLTLPELIFGGSVASSHRTTFFGGGSSGSTRTQTQTQTTTTTQTKSAPKTVTQTVPAQTQTQTTTTPSQTTTTPDTSTQTAPSGGATTPTDTGTSTTPAPGATAPPAP
jgi:hypothetical protein